MARIGLVLGAGGVTGGAFHAGVLAALAESIGWDARTADVIVGTSAGSVTAAGLRAGIAAPDLAARALGEPLSDEATAILAAAGVPAAPPRPPFGTRARLGGRPAAPEVVLAAMRRPWRVRPGALAAGLLPAGSVDTAAIAQGMDALHRAGWPVAPMWVCAVRARDGALVVFGRDGAPEASVGGAVAASCAIPGYFAPVEIGGDRYVDGGVHSLTNVEALADHGLDLVLVSAPIARAGRRYTPGSAMREIGRVQLSLELQRVRRRGAEVITFTPGEDDERAMGLNAMESGRRAPVTARVRESTLRRLDDPRLRARLTALEH